MTAIKPGTIVGYAIVTETYKHEVSQEFAGASETIEVPAGRYPIEVTNTRGGIGAAYIRMAGTSVFRGWFGTNTRVSREPKPAVGHEHIYMYELANAIKNGGKRWSKDPMTLELADGFGLVPCGQSFEIAQV